MPAPAAAAPPCRRAAHTRGASGHRGGGHWLVCVACADLEVRPVPELATTATDGDSAETEALAPGREERERARERSARSREVRCEIGAGDVRRGVRPGVAGGWRLPPPRARPPPAVSSGQQPAPASQHHHHTPTRPANVSRGREDARGRRPGPLARVDTWRWHGDSAGALVLLACRGERRRERRTPCRNRLDMQNGCADL